jgi:hypothetical protein
MKIWVNEQVDPCGIVYSCIACQSEDRAKDCHETWTKNLTETQKQEGWLATMRTVESWDDVPVNALKLN